MEHLSIWFFKLLSWVFTIGWIGCLATIPLAAYKFLSVLFEDNAEDEQGHQEFVSSSIASPK